MEQLFIIIVSVIAGGAAVAIYNYIRALTERIKKLEDQLKGPKRLPYASADALEDLIATLNSEAFHLNFRNDLINNALAHAYRARNPEKKEL